METNQLIKFPFYARLALTLLSIFLIMMFMYVGHKLIIPLFFSALLAILLLPLVQWMQRKGLPNGIAAIISLLLFVVSVFLIFFFLGKQIVSFSQDVPQLAERINAWIVELEQWIEQRFGIDSKAQMGYLTQASEGIAHTATIVAQSVFLTTGSLLIWTVFVFIFSFFMLTHRRLIHRFFLLLFREKDHERVNEALGETKMLVNGYILGLILEMIIVAVLSGIAFMLFGIKYAVMLAIICGLLNVIPYIGIYTAMAIGAIITLSNSTPAHALSLIIISVVIHFIDANVILPRIVGGRVQMNPLVTIVAVMVGSMIWGIAGMFLFIPLAAILKIVFSKVTGMEAWSVLMGMEEREKKQRTKRL